MLDDGDAVLDLGCGCGVPATAMLAERFSVTGVDISPVQIERARRLVPAGRFQCEDMTRVEFPLESFAAIVSFLAIIHVPVEEQPALLRKLSRWLRPGGHLLATAPGCTGAMPTARPTWAGSAKRGSRCCPPVSFPKETAGIRSCWRNEDGSYNEHMGTHRVERVAAQLREEISQIIIRDLKDPRIGMATITDVKLSPDLRNATVKVSVVGEDDARAAAIDGLDHAKGFIRRELGSRLSNLRFAPDLRFELDLGVAYSVRVSQLLREVEQGEPHAGS